MSHTTDCLATLTNIPWDTSIFTSFRSVFQFMISKERYQKEGYSKITAPTYVLYHGKFKALWRSSKITSTKMHAVFKLLRRNMGHAKSLQSSIYQLLQLHVLSSSPCLQDTVGFWAQEENLQLWFHWIPKDILLAKSCSKRPMSSLRRTFWAREALGWCTRVSWMKVENLLL